MQRFDLRHKKADFYDDMLNKMNSEVATNEVAIFLFEIGDFSSVQKSADLVKENGYTLMNSLKFNEVDWTIVVKKSAE
jgi:NADH-quinone oxidoreductase subunit E